MVNINVVHKKETKYLVKYLITKKFFAYICPDLKDFQLILSSLIFVTTNVTQVSFQVTLVYSNVFPGYMKLNHHLVTSHPLELEIFLDISKTFNKVRYEGLLFKLKFMEWKVIYSEKLV